MSLAVEVLRNVPYGFLVTSGSPPTARLVQHLRVEDDGVVWIGTSPEGDDFVLVRVRPHVVEAMSFADGLHPDPYGLVPGMAERSNGAWSDVEPTQLPRR